MGGYNRWIGGWILREEDVLSEWIRRMDDQDG